ncbi:MAG: aldo/keto reductase family oxidoreductase [Acidimicrobiales bacterium]
MTNNLVSAAPRQLGGINRVGALGFGCWRLTGASDAENERLVSTAVDLGMTLIDNADVYGLDWGGSGFGACEEALGRVLAINPSLRGRITLASKGGIIPGTPYDSSATYIVAACEASLRRMGVERVELWQIHRPDHFTHPAEIAEAFSSLHKRGLVGAFGVSNFTPAQTLALSTHVELPLVSTQPEFSCVALGAMRDGTLDLCMETGMVPLAWSPLAGGRIVTGEGVRPELTAVLDDLASREGASRAVIAVAFVLAPPSRPVALLGTQQFSRLADLATATTVALDRADVYRIVQASDGVPLP